MILFDCYNQGFSCKAFLILIDSATNFLNLEENFAKCNNYCRIQRTFDKCIIWIMTLNKTSSILISAAQASSVHRLDQTYLDNLTFP